MGTQWGFLYLGIIDSNCPGNCYINRLYTYKIDFVEQDFHI